METMSPRVLLTSVIRPFGGPGEGDSVGAELFHAQVTRAQGAFSLRQVIRVWGLDLIAENIDAPTVVLHYPSEGELVRELRAHRYTHVGINFVVATFHKVRVMVDAIRRVSPGTKIILGGYGTVLPDDMLRPWADHLCREEGVRFMRRLLGEDESRAIKAPHSPVPSSSVLGYQPPTIVGHVTAGLGCANGCDFCCTSHFFKRQYVRLQGSGSDIYEAMAETRARAEREGQTMGSFALIDEDFFLYRRRAEEFLEAVRRSGKPMSIFGFGSVKGLSQFKASEIAEMGFDLVWTAFEGKKAGYAKLEGRPIPELYEDLKQHGVATLSSMIIGFPYQDEATINAEFDDLMRLEPALSQILIYFAFPGTPFFEEVLRDKRFLPHYDKSPDLRRWDGFALHMHHPHFTPERLEALQRRLYDEDFRRLGPSIHRLARVWLRGSEHLRTSPNPLLRARAERLRESARGVMPTFLASRLLLRSPEARQRGQALERDLLAQTGPRTLREAIIAPVAAGLGAVAEVAGRLGVLQQPGLLRVAHRMGDGAARTGGVLGLQGSARRLPSRLREDFQHLVVDRFSRPRLSPVLPTDGWKPVPADRTSLTVLPA
jgi:alkylhydroperoxidase family enzyme